MTSDSGSDRQAKTPQAVEGEASQSGGTCAASPKTQDLIVSSPSEEGLKPCPFCGNDGSGPVEHALHIVHIEDAEHHAYDRYTIQCDKCTATMGYFDSEDEAVEAWNNRPKPNEGEIERLLRVARDYVQDAASCSFSMKHPDTLKRQAQCDLEAIDAALASSTPVDSREKLK